MTDPEVVDVPELDQPVLFTVGGANGYVSLHDPGVLMVCTSSGEPFDDVAMAAISEQAEHHGYPFLSGVDMEDWECGGEDVTSVELWFTRSLSDALAG